MKDPVHEASEGALLREVIFDPVAQYLHGNNRLYIVADGELNTCHSKYYPRMVINTSLITITSAI